MFPSHDRANKLEIIIKAVTAFVGLFGRVYKIIKGKKNAETNKIRSDSKAIGDQIKGNLDSIPGAINSAKARAREFGKWLRDQFKSDLSTKKERDFKHPRSNRPR